MVSDGGVALAVGSAWAMGAGATALLWPRHVALPLSAHVALSGLLGPLFIGALLLASGAGSRPPAFTRVAVTTAAAACVLAGTLARRASPGSMTSRPAAIAAALVLGASICFTTWVTTRTHLGYDGTVVWYQKARIIADAGGAMPSAYLADATRAWSAPDYPLHVPLALAWVRLWQDREDERAVKVVPAGWLAAMLCLTFAAITERRGGGSRARALALAGVVTLATAPRLLVGEGSVTSGYADGPYAGVLACAVWLAWRSTWGADHRWHALLAVLLGALVFTKQEGVAATAVVLLVCAVRGGVRHIGFGVPALALAAGWSLWTIQHDAAVVMAYAWPGVRAVLLRVPVILGAYAAEVLTVQVWGVLWPALACAAAACPARGSGPAWTMVAGVIASGMAAFTCSAWPDLASHLAVTVPRQLIQVAPVAVILALSGNHARSDD